MCPPQRSMTAAGHPGHRPASCSRSRSSWAPGIHVGDDRHPTACTPAAGPGWAVRRGGARRSAADASWLGPVCPPLRGARAPWTAPVGHPPRHAARPFSAKEACMGRAFFPCMARRAQRFVQTAVRRAMINNSGEVLRYGGRRRSHAHWRGATLSGQLTTVSGCNLRSTRAHPSVPGSPPVSLTSGFGRRGGPAPCAAITGIESSATGPSWAGRLDAPTERPMDRCAGGGAMRGNHWY